jgi:hypothetical protein
VRVVSPYFVVYPKIKCTNTCSRICINRDHFISFLDINLPSWRGFLAEICTLIGKFSLFFLVTLSCGGFIYDI